MHGSDLEITISPAGDIVTVAMIGETHFDFDTAEEHINTVLGYKPRVVVVDASRLTFISSIGMCFLINLRRAVRDGGGVLRLAALQPLVFKAMEHAHVLHLFEIHADPTAAREAPRAT